MEKADSLNVRCLLLGDSRVGKTSLRLRLFSYFTDEYYPSTLCFKHTLPELAMQIEGTELPVHFEIWDYPGDKTQWNIPLNTTASGIDVVIYCFSISDNQSLENVNKWHEEFVATGSTVPAFLVGLKSDLRSLNDSDTDPSGLIGVSHVPLVEIEKAKTAMKRLGNSCVRYIECSAKTSAGVHKVFRKIAQTVLHKKKTKSPPLSAVDPRDGLVKSGQTDAKNGSLRQSNASLRTSTNQITNRTGTKEEGVPNRIIINEADLVSLAESEDDFPILDIIESSDVERKEIERKMKSFKDNDTIPLNESFQWEESEAADRSEEEFSEVSDDEYIYSRSLLKSRGISVLLHRTFKAEKEQLPPIFKMVASFAVNVLTNAYVNLSHRFLIARIEKTVIEYMRLVRSLLRKNLFHKWVKNFRMRKYLDQYSSQLFISCNELARNVGFVPKKPSPNQVKNIIRDFEGKKFWKNNFGLNVLYVSWDSFINCWKTAAFESSRDLLHVIPFLRYTLDVSYTNSVNQFAFNEFLMKFGKFSESLDRAEAICQEHWFFGYMTSQEASYLLSKEPGGTFLVRYGATAAFALAYVDLHGNNTVKHSTVEFTLTNGYSVEEAQADKAKKKRYFASLPELVAHYMTFLFHRPTFKNWPRKPWFFGDVSTKDCTVLLAEKKSGSFLIRFSQTKRGVLVISYVIQGKMFHTLVDSYDGGVICDGTPYKSIDELLYKHRKIFMHPFFSLTLPEVKKPIPEAFTRYSLTIQTNKERLPPIEPGSPRKDQRMGPLPPPNMGSLASIADNSETGYSPADATPGSGPAPARSNSPPSASLSPGDSVPRTKAHSSPKMDLSRSREVLSPAAEKKEPSSTGDIAVPEEDMKTLREMGFSEVNIRKAMKKAKGSIIDAAQLLMDEAKAKLMGMLERKNSSSLNSSSASLPNNNTN